MKPISYTVGLVAAAALLSGCVATMPQAASDFGTQAVGKVRNAFTPDAYTAYKATLEQERATLAGVVNKAPASGQPANTTAWLDSEVRYHRGTQVWAVNATKEFRLALPSDAVMAKHKAAAELIESFTKYTLTRADKTGIVVTAPAAADRAWMASVARQAGALKVEEQTQSYVAIGWNSPEFQADRQVQ